MRRYLGSSPKFDIVVAKDTEFAGFAFEVAAVKNQEFFCSADSVVEIHTECAAVCNNVIRIGKGVLVVESFNYSDSEAFVCPEDVSDPQDQTRNIFEVLHI